MKKQILPILNIVMLCILATLPMEWLKAQTFSTFASTSSYCISLAFDASGNLYATNYNSTYLTKITPTGVSSAFGTTGSGSNGIAIDAVGNLYVCANNETYITKITPAGVSSTLGSTGGAGSGIALDAVGNIYVANASLNTVTTTTSNGVTTTYGTTGTDPQNPVFDDMGNLYVVNFVSNNVTKITPAGVSSIFATTGIKPYGIVMDKVGNLFVSNTESNTVTKITPAGIASTFGTTGNYPIGIIIDSVGNIFTANYLSDNITKITPAGVSTTFGSFSAPAAFVIDKAGYMYVSNAGSNTISKSNAPVAVVLPIQLINFAAQKQGNNSLLTWQTTSEKNSNYFSIERSSDGNTFIAIGKVLAAGNSTTTKTYQFSDANPLTGVNYYRLKEIDIDGKATYSSVQSVNFGIKQTIAIYPNPLHNQATIIGTEAGMYITLFNAMGQRIYNQTATNNSTTLATEKLPAGIYQARVYNNNNNIITTLQLVKE